MINKNLVRQAMSEDLKPSGDITTKLIKNNKKIKAKIISNQNCVIGGLGFAKEAFKYSDKKKIGAIQARISPSFLRKNLDLLNLN